MTQERVTTVSTGPTTTVTTGPSGAEVLRRIVVFVFGLIQAVILLRIVLLLINASASNSIVHAIYDISNWFVAPFEGIVRTNALNAGASVLDVTAIVALIGWTILELLVIGAINVLRREA